MNGFSIYKTNNFNLESFSEWRFPTQQSLNYIWLNDQVLTHFFYEPKANSNIKLDFLVKLTVALTPTIENKLALNTECVGELINWKTMVLGEDINGLIAFIEKLFVKQPNLNQPLSVIVCTNNNVDDLRNCLSALKCSLSDKDEIIVVDYAKDNNYTELLLENFPEILYVRETNPSLAKARNVGIKLAKNSIVAFTDEKVIVGEIWADEIRNSFINRNIMAITGLVIPVEINSMTKPYFNRNWSYSRGYSEQFFDCKYFNDRIENKQPFWGIAVKSNMAFRKSIFDIVSYFDETLVNELIDELLVFKLLSKGWECVYHPSVYVYEQSIVKSADLKKQLFNQMKAQTFWLFQNDNCKPIYKNLPFYYYRRLLNCNKGDKLDTISGVKAEIFGTITGLFAYLTYRIKYNKSVSKEIIFNNTIPQFTTK